MQGAFYELGHDARLGADGEAQTKTFVYHVATGEWDSNGPAGVVLSNATVGSMFFNGGNTYSVNSNIIRGDIDPFEIDAGLKIGDVFSGKISLTLGGGAKEYVNLVLNDQNIPDVGLPPNLCGGASVPLRDGGFTSFMGSQVVFDTWGDLGLVASGSGGPFMTKIGVEMFQPSGAPPVFPQPFNGCLPTPEIYYTAPLPSFSADGEANAVDRMASTKLGIVGTRFWANDVVRIPAFGGDKVETVVSNIPHPMGIAGFPSKIAGSYGVVVGISIQSPVNILMTDAQGRRLGMDLQTGEPVNDFGNDGVDSGPGTHPRYFFVKDPAPGPYTVQTVGTGDGPYTVDVYSADSSTGLGGRITHTGTAAVGSVASHDFALGANASLVSTAPSVNRDPFAVAGPDQTIDAADVAGAVVHLDGSASSDPDGDALSYVWSGPFGVMSGAAISPRLAPGVHAITLTVDDAHGGSAKATVIVTVNGSANSAPSANAGADQTVEATSPAGAIVSLDGSASTDADHDALTFTWSGPFGVVAGVTASVQLPLGTHTIALLVEDGHGHSAVASVRVTVRDSAPPVIAIASPAGSYVLGQAVTASYSCTDGGSGIASCAGPIASGLPVDTSSAGTRTFPVSATDAAGNTAHSTSTYSITYNVCLEEAGTRDGHGDGDSGLVRLQICTARGANRSSKTIGVTAVDLVNAATGARESLDGATGGRHERAFRFEPSFGGGEGGYVFKLQLEKLAPGVHSLIFSIEGDPAPHHVDIEVPARGHDRH